MGGTCSDAPIRLVCYTGWCASSVAFGEDCIKTEHLQQTSNCHGMGDISVFMVYTEVTAEKDSKEGCLKLGDLNIFPCGVLFLCTLFFVGALSYSLFLCVGR